MLIAFGFRRLKAPRGIMPKSIKNGLKNRRKCAIYRRAQIDFCSEFC